MVNQVDKLMVSYTLQAKSHLNLLNENDGREDATQNWKDKEPRFILLEREAELQTSNTSVICVVDHSKMLFPVLMTDMVEMLIWGKDYVELFDLLRKKWGIKVNICGVCKEVSCKQSSKSCK